MACGTGTGARARACSGLRAVTTAQGELAAAWREGCAGVRRLTRRGGGGGRAGGAVHPWHHVVVHLCRQLAICASHCAYAIAMARRRAAPPGDGGSPPTPAAGAVAGGGGGGGEVRWWLRAARAGLPACVALEAALAAGELMMGEGVGRGGLAGGRCAFSLSCLQHRAGCIAGETGVVEHLAACRSALARDLCGALACMDPAGASTAAAAALRAPADRLTSQPHDALLWAALGEVEPFGVLWPRHTHAVVAGRMPS